MTHLVTPNNIEIVRLEISQINPTGIYSSQIWEKIGKKPEVIVSSVSPLEATLLLFDLKKEQLKCMNNQEKQKYATPTRNVRSKHQSDGKIKL